MTNKHLYDVIATSITIARGVHRKLGTRAQSRPFCVQISNHFRHENLVFRTLVLSENLIPSILCSLQPEQEQRKKVLKEHALRVFPLKHSCKATNGCHYNTEGNKHSAENVVIWYSQEKDKRVPIKEASHCPNLLYSISWKSSVNFRFAASRVYDS